MEREDLRVIRGRISVVIQAEAERRHAAPAEAYRLANMLTRRGFSVAVRLVGQVRDPPRPTLRPVA
jgi:hypothetical protein